MFKMDCLRQRRQRRLASRSLPLRSEKNWALAVTGNQGVLILHQLAPCLVWLRFAPAAPKGLQLVRGTCFTDEVHALGFTYVTSQHTQAQSWYRAPAALAKPVISTSTVCTCITWNTADTQCTLMFVWRTHSRIAAHSNERRCGTSRARP